MVALPWEPTAAMATHCWLVGTTIHVLHSQWNVGHVQSGYSIGQASGKRILIAVSCRGMLKCPCSIGIQKRFSRARVALSNSKSPLDLIASSAMSAPG